MLPTADISDKYSDSVRILKPLFRDYGGVKSFSGKVKTIKTLDDNTKVRAALASQNNWSGIIVNGCIRDQLEIKEEKIGVKALNSNPKKSNKNDGGEFGVDLNFADTDISEGDYIYADEDGIIISKEDLQI